MKPMKNPTLTPTPDPARTALAEAIAAWSAANDRVASARTALETARQHSDEAERKAAAAREALEGIDERELGEMAAAIASGAVLAPGRSLRARLTAESDALDEEAEAAEATVKQLKKVHANFADELPTFSKRVDAAIGDVLAPSVEAVLNEAVELTAALRLKRRLLYSPLLRRLIDFRSPLGTRLERFEGVAREDVLGMNVSPATAAAEVAAWTAAAAALAVDADAPLP